MLSELGAFALERCGTFREAVSYRPMLSRLETLLYGNPRLVFAHDADGHELHVDRTMNVLASGFMHLRYFNDMARVHLRGTFDELPLAEQPVREAAQLQRLRGMLVDAQRSIAVAHRRDGSRLREA